MQNKNDIITTDVSASKISIIIATVATLVYFSWWFNLSHVGNIYLYGALFIGEVYHVFQALGYLYTVWDQKKVKQMKVNKFFPVDVFITVCGEPVEVVERTLKAITEMDYPCFKTFVLNDGLSRGKENWKDIDDLALRYGATPITRTHNKGNKAGNINNALATTHSHFFAIFDADHAPTKNFLTRVMGYFEDPKIALVQTPQYYENKDHSYLTNASWEQQELFFGPICKGKNRLSATFWCGTNAVVRKEALLEVGGVPESNIAEDFLASLFMHEKGWKSIYVPEILAYGLAPHNLGDYVNQQFRWARGSLEVIFKYNPLFRKGLTFAQKIQYLYSSGYYLNGIIVLIDAIVPIIALTTNVLPVNANTADFMIYFFPFIFSTIYVLMHSTKHQITFTSIQMSISSFWVFITAIFSTVFGMKVKFNITSKSVETGNFLHLAIPHFLYVIVGVSSILFAIYRNGLTPSVITNGSWILFNIVFFLGFIKVAYPWEELFSGITSVKKMTAKPDYLKTVKNLKAYVQAGVKLKGLKNGK